MAYIVYDWEDKEVDRVATEIEAERLAEDNDGWFEYIDDEVDDD